MSLPIAWQSRQFILNIVKWGKCCKWWSKTLISPTHPHIQMLSLHIGAKLLITIAIYYLQSVQESLHIYGPSSIIMDKHTYINTPIQSQVYMHACQHSCAHTHSCYMHANMHKHRKLTQAKKFYHISTTIRHSFSHIYINLSHAITYRKPY